MEKEFNVTGRCYSHLHYMADTTAKNNEALKLIEKGQYFAINRPRQFFYAKILRGIGLFQKKCAISNTCNAFFMCKILIIRQLRLKEPLN
jgi:hypothetical protein